MNGADQVKVIVLRTAGTNCDRETVFAFQESGAAVDLVHVEQLFSARASLADYHILAVPGGFTYGDDIESGRILANELRLRLGKDIRRFIDDGKLIIGICNGFQVLVKAGILPGLSQQENAAGKDFTQTATLISNDSGKFEDRWVRLKLDGRCVWTEGMSGSVFFPVAHGEGKFVVRDKEILNRLNQNRQIVFRYCTSEGLKPSYPDNPNGSLDDIAGICDPTGRILGLMPHPERHFLFIQHPFWTRLEGTSVLGEGARIFQNGVAYVKKNLLKNCQEATV